MSCSPGPHRCWQVRSPSQALLGGTKELLPQLTWAGGGKEGTSQAHGGFCQLILLGKARYKFHGQNARVGKCWKQPQRGPRTLLLGRQRAEGWQELVGEEQVAQRGLLFSEARSKAQGRKREIPSLRGGRAARDRVFISEHEENKALCQKAVLVQMSRLRRSSLFLGFGSTRLTASALQGQVHTVGF